MQPFSPEKKMKRNKETKQIDRLVEDGRIGGADEDAVATGGDEEVGEEAEAGGVDPVVVRDQHRRQVDRGRRAVHSGRRRGGVEAGGAKLGGQEWKNKRGFFPRLINL